MYLQENSSGQWRTIDSWRFSGTGSAYISKSSIGSSRSSYRIRVSVTVNGESATVYSSTIQIP